ncbi:MAG: DUF6223 family protein [Streptosporangiaceae bacterium]
MRPAEALIMAGDLGTGNERAGAVLASAVALIGVVLGGLALARSAPRTATAGAAAGLLGTALAGLHLATSSGGFGTGNGRAGAYVALVIGLTAVITGTLARARSHRTTPTA